ncbi:hypothetical protein P43SY_000298 [Pythium insidiosum]|uniref:Bzip transcription factor n=1 Tax=Pythium insidiosum TaxID=114742 RepID=A0AAD5LIW3_PYTIN|nr:hypothetical protein P43SY_000298 [Pythium insidiosum]
MATSPPLAVSARPQGKAGARRARTSSERGRAYRERMRSYEQNLEDGIAALRTRVLELESRCSLFAARTLQRRHDVHGSLAKLVHTYYTRFQESMAVTSAPHARIAAMFNPQSRGTLQDAELRFQEQFLLQIMDPDVVAGDLVGPLAILDQWRRYAASHASFRGVVKSITMSGPEDNPVVVLKAQATGIITGATFLTLFPHVMTANNALVQHFLGRRVTYDITIQYLFTEHGHISSETVDINLVNGLLRAGGSLDQVSELLRHSAVSPHSTIQSPEDQLTVYQRGRVAEYKWGHSDELAGSPQSVTDPTTSPTSHKRLRVEFLLSES